MRTRGPVPLFHAGLMLAATIALCGEESKLTTITVRTREELVQAVQAAKPGATIAIAPGTYRGGLYWTNLRGTKDQPIVLAALDPARPPVINGGADCLHLVDAEYVELRDLVFTKATGNGLNIDDGETFETPARGIALRNLQIRDVGPDGNCDGIKLSGVDDFTVENCTFERWGTGGSGIDMVGCHRGRIGECTFRHRSNVPGNGVQTKGGTRDVTISRCHFENAGERAVQLGGTTGLQFFRPKPAGYEAKDITVEDCTIIGSMAAIAFVGVDGATVRHNTLYRPTGWIMRILQETTGPDFVPCRKGAFAHNVVVFRADELRTAVNVGGNTDPKSFTFAGNHWYCLDNPARSAELSLPVKETNGSYGANPLFQNAEKGDLRLKPASPVKDAGVREKTN